MKTKFLENWIFWVALVILFRIVASPIITTKKNISPKSFEKILEISLKNKNEENAKEIINILLSLYPDEKEEIRKDIKNKISDDLYNKYFSPTPIEILSSVLKNSFKIELLNIFKNLSFYFLIFLTFLITFIIPFIIIFFINKKALIKIFGKYLGKIYIFLNILICILIFFLINSNKMLIYQIVIVTWLFINIFLFFRSKAIGILLGISYKNSKKLCILLVMIILLSTIPEHLKFNSNLSKENVKIITKAIDNSIKYDKEKVLPYLYKILEKPYFYPMPVIEHSIKALGILGGENELIILFKFLNFPEKSIQDISLISIEKIIYKN